METLTIPFFDTDKDRQFYLHLVEAVGQNQANRYATEIFANDFGSLGWEIIRSPHPNRYLYKIIKVDGEVRLVHQRDFWEDADILGKINPGIRNGLEYAQMRLVRENLLSAEIGSSLAWISPKKILPEDPDYVLTFLHNATKIDVDTITVTQTQANYGLEESAMLLNMWSKLDIVDPHPTLKELMTTVSQRRESGIVYDTTRSISNKLLNGGKLYIEAIKQGLDGATLDQRYNDILKATIDYQAFKKLYPSGGRVMTSCGQVDFGGNLPSWCEKCLEGGGLRCKFCRKNLGFNEINSHRCVC